MMPDEPPQIQLASTYPSAPKEYYSLYTNDNVKAGRTPQPPPTIKDNYLTFGKLVDPNDVLIRSLESQGIQRLYRTPADLGSDGLAPAATANYHKTELKKLNHSILIAYLDLLDILVKAPMTPLAMSSSDEEAAQAAMIDPKFAPKTLREQKLEDIELLFINMHHLINELRPHQARDNIRCILELQKHQRMVIAQKFRTHLHKIVGLLKQCIESIQLPTASVKGSNKMNQFIEELNGLMKNANDLTKRLEKFDVVTKQTTKANDEDDESVEMKDESAPPASDNAVTATVTDKPTKAVTSVAGSASNRNRNCDLNDLILCDLVDDFLTKQNEF